MIAMSDRDGIVEASVPGLANAAHLTIPETEAALGVLLSPDPYSRTPDYEGRRIEAIDGGWRLLNKEKYRDKEGIEERRQKDRERQARKRARDRERCHVTSRENPRSDQNITDQNRTTPRDPPTTYQDECAELERRRQGGGPSDPPFQPQIGCTDCNSGPMVLMPSKFPGSGYYYRCQVCNATVDAGAVEKRRAHKSGQGPSERPPQVICGGCSNPAPPGQRYCPDCQRILDAQQR